jgi:hypothetical protein
MQRSYSIFYSPTNGAFAKRYPALAHLPCILDARPGYHRLANLYLMDRGLGLWRSQGSARSAIPTKKTMHSYAHWLANFLEWAEVRSVDLNTCSYSAHVAGRYQSEMLEGTWSRDGQGRRASTVNARVQQACDFLTWMVEKGFRGVFEIPYETQQLTIGSATRAMGQMTRQVRVRGGKARAQNRALHMPTNAAVRQWLARVNESAGATLGLMCETVLLTAIRREEVACLRIDTLPEDPRDWKISNPSAPESKQLVRISIEFGTKGQSYGEDHADKIGPERSILIPLSLARRWHAYRNGDRNLAFKRWMDGVKGAEARRTRAREAVHLFLREDNGSRISGKKLYDAWVSVELPIEGWSPHQGRHWWACSVLWRELQKHENIGQLSSETATALLESTALSIIRLHIQPQLGHAQDSTTMIYMGWVMDMVSRPVSLDDDLSFDKNDHAFRKDIHQ